MNEFIRTNMITRLECQMCYKIAWFWFLKFKHNRRKIWFVCISDSGATSARHEKFKLFVFGAQWVKKSIID